jgi:hypothetical protein
LKSILGVTYDDRHALTRIKLEDVRLIRGVWLAVRHDELDAVGAQELTGAATGRA